MRTGTLLPAGSPGEVVIRGPGVMSGYVNNPAATAEAFFGDWFRTGDRGALRDGYLFLEGRLKEMIIRGGENIAPAEIEQVLMSHPAVQDAVCFGVADAKYGELVAAAVTLTADASARELVGALPGEPGRIQGAVQDRRADRDTAHSDRQGPAAAGGGIRRAAAA